MSGEEAVRVAAILATADGCCSVCAEKLAAWAQREFPEHDWFALVMVEHFEYGLGDRPEGWLREVVS